MGMIRKNGLYCAYLRKSRADIEEEARGQGETLARHQRILNELAGRVNIAIAQVYREIVSGDTIAERPEIRRLLDDVNAGMWDGVLVVDVDRLGRGDSIDQGVIMQSFLYANTLIVTPEKTYDPSDDSDAEFFEIKLFFSRREYTMIKKRMQRGRLSSVMDGCYMGSRPVYGYERYKLQGRKGWSLRIIPDKAAIVRAIFEWYAYGIEGESVGCGIIADKLNNMGLKTDLGNRFVPSYVKVILHNPVYIGKVQWNQRVTTYRIEDGTRKKSREKNDNALIIEGLHEPIIEEGLFNLVQGIFKSRDKLPRAAKDKIANPFAGLIVCGECGRSICRKPDKSRPDASLGCVTQHCPTSATYVGVVENSVLDILKQWVADFEADAALPVTSDQANATANAATCQQLIQQRQMLEAQFSRLYDLLEQQVYTISIYRQRHAELMERIEEINENITTLSHSQKKDARTELIPRVKTVLTAYGQASDAAEKNNLLRSVIERIVYHKTRRCYRNNAPGDYLSLEVYPRLPDGSIF